MRTHRRGREEKSRKVGGRGGCHRRLALNYWVAILVEENLAIFIDHRNLRIWVHTRVRAEDDNPKARYVDRREEHTSTQWSLELSTVRLEGAMRADERGRRAETKGAETKARALQDCRPRHTRGSARGCRPRRARAPARRQQKTVALGAAP